MHTGTKVRKHLTIDVTEDWLMNCSTREFWELVVEMSIVKPKDILKKYEL